MSANKKITAVLMASTVAVLSSSVCAEQVDVQEELMYQDLGTGADLRIAGANQPQRFEPKSAGSGASPQDGRLGSGQSKGGTFYKGKRVADDEGDDSKGAEGKCGEGSCGDGAKKKVPVDTSMNGKR